MTAAAAIGGALDRVNDMKASRSARLMRARSAVKDVWVPRNVAAPVPPIRCPHRTP